MKTERPKATGIKIFLTQAQWKPGECKIKEKEV